MEVLLFERLDGLNQTHPLSNSSMVTHSKPHRMFLYRPTTRMSGQELMVDEPVLITLCQGSGLGPWHKSCIPDRGLSLVFRLCLSIRYPKRGIMLLSCSVSVWSEYEFSHTAVPTRFSVALDLQVSRRVRKS